MSQPTIPTAHHTGVLYGNNNEPLVPKFAAIAVSSSGDNTVVGAVAGKKIRVLAYNYMAAGTVNAKWVGLTAAGATDTGRAFLVVNTGKVVPFCPVGWGETAAGSALKLNLSAAIAVEGEVVYVEV